MVNGPEQELLNIKWQAGHPWLQDTNEKQYGSWIIAENFLEGEAFFLVRENSIGQVHFESHSPEWPALLKFSFHHWEVILIL